MPAKGGTAAVGKTGSAERKISGRPAEPARNNAKPSTSGEAEGFASSVATARGSAPARSFGKSTRPDLQAGQTTSRVAAANASAPTPQQAVPKQARASEVPKGDGSGSGTPAGDASAGIFKIDADNVNQMAQEVASMPPSGNADFASPADAREAQKSIEADARSNLQSAFANDGFHREKVLDPSASGDPSSHLTEVTIRTMFPSRRDYDTTERNIGRAAGTVDASGVPSADRYNDLIRETKNAAQAANEKSASIGSHEQLVDQLRLADGALSRTYKEEYNGRISDAVKNQLTRTQGPANNSFWSSSWSPSQLAGSTQVDNLLKSLQHDDPSLDLQPVKDGWQDWFSNS